MEDLNKNIRKSEGFESKPYIDVLVKQNPQKYGISQDEMDVIVKHFDKLKVTFGFGFTFITKIESNQVLDLKLEAIKDELISKKSIVATLSESRQNVLYEMAYQLGIAGLLKFKKMWDAIEDGDYFLVLLEMLNSRWAKQTPERAKYLALVMRG